MMLFLIDRIELNCLISIGLITFLIKKYLPMQPNCILLRLTYIYLLIDFHKDELKASNVDFIVINF